MLYKKVFCMYLILVFDFVYIEKMMNINMMYYVMFDYDCLISVVSVEINFEFGYVEIIDCVVFLEY